MSTAETQNPRTPEELAGLIHSLTVFDVDSRGGYGYEASADTMWKAALAAFEYVARQVGATRPQASRAALKFYGEAMNIEGPFGVYKLEDALYPQYDLPGRLEAFIEENRDWLREQAAEKLGREPEHDRQGRSPGCRALAEVGGVMTLDTFPTYLVIDLGRRSGHVDRLQWLINEIEEQSQPPKPAEPKGAGAVVEDRTGDWWVLLSRGSEGAHWHRVGVPDKRAGWSAIHVVKVLSEGVSP